jgi:pyruvate formate lyase activating enzyme
LCGGRLADVLDTLVWIKRETNVWLEVTTLLIPGENDSDGEIDALSAWFAAELGCDVPLHFTAFHPDFKLQDKPRTPPETLHAARRIALDVGLHYVYEGNIFSDGAHTTCPSCGTVLIRRSWHDVQQNRLKDGRCPKCGMEIAGRWANPHGKTPPKAYQRARAVAESKYSDLNL